jgi:LysM repeat protein
VSAPQRRRRWLIGIAVGVVTLLPRGVAQAGSAAAQGSRPAALSGYGQHQRSVAQLPAIHIVKRGESLSVIAHRYRVTVPALVTANHLRGAATPIRAGQRLIVPAPAAVAASRGAPEPLPNVAHGMPSLERAVRFEWPVEGVVTSPFGPRRSGWHRGIDIQAEMGTPVRASAAGIVVASGYEDRYGFVVKIEHSPGIMTIYAHTLQNLVEAGEEVQAGQVIGQVGRSGLASNYHLHFEIRHAGAAYDPVLLLPLSLPFAPPGVAGAVVDRTGAVAASEDHSGASDETHDDGR